MRSVSKLWGASLILPILLSLVAGTGLGLESGDSISVDTSAPTRSGCFGHGRDGHDQPWSLARCTFALMGAQGTILLVGDSTAASLADGAIAAAHKLDRSIIVFPSRGCLFAARQPYSYEWCDSYSMEAEELIEELEPEILMFTAYLSRMDLEDRRIRLPDGSLPTSREERIRAVMLAIGEQLVLARKQQPGMPIIVVGEVPTVQFSPRPTLLFDRSGTREVNRESMGFKRQQEYVRRLKQITSSIEGVRFLDITETFCDEQQCSAISKSGELLYMDSYHLNPNGSKLLVPQLMSILDLSIQET